MRRSASRKPALVMAAVLLAGGWALAWGTPLASRSAAEASERLVAAGNASVQADPTVALRRYRLASYLEPAGEGSLLAAKLLLAGNRPDEASRALEWRLQHHPTPEHLVLKSQILLEQGRGGEAAAAAQAAKSIGGGNEADAWLATTYAALGRKEELAELAAVSSPEAAETLKTLMLDKVALARTLYGQRLLMSSERVLASELGTSSEASLLAAKIKLALVPAEPQAAKKLLEDGIRLDPANLDLHRLLLDVASRLNDQALADRERDLVRRLEQGKP